MTSGEMVTDFAIRRNWERMPDGRMRNPEFAPVRELLGALNAYLESTGNVPGEYGFSCSYDRDPDRLVPSRYRWLVAYAVEGGSEGYYVHVGAIVHDHGNGPTTYVEFGLCKTWDAESAYAIARECQRFLTAAEWN